MNANGLKWVKIGRDDYATACGRFHVARLEACDNKYANRDEWILSVKQGEGREAVDVFPLLREAKQAAEDFPK